MDSTVVRRADIDHRHSHSAQRAVRTICARSAKPRSPWTAAPAATPDAAEAITSTKARLDPGGLLTTGFTSNYRPEIVMNHIYFTALPNGAGLAAEVAALDDSEPHVYEVEPTGPYENDPNVTGKKFPGNPTRSYLGQSVPTMVSYGERC